MRLTYLNDALDHWKGRVIQLLRGRGALRSLGALAMITDARPWNPAEQESYARMIAVEPENIDFSPFTVEACRNRGNYFASSAIAARAGDLFLDPNTGISDRAIGRDHVTVAEVCTLLSQHPDRVAVMYVHMAREHDYLERRAESFPRAVDVIAFDCGQVGMLFAAHDSERADAVETALRAWLAPDPNQRLSRW